LARLQATLAAGKPIIGAWSSVGIVAKCAEKGGADLIIVYSTGRARIMGLPTTVLGQSNPETLAMYEEIENVVDRTPIVGGAQAGDPTYRRLPKLIDAFRNTGFDGIINFPSVGNKPDYARLREHIGQGLRHEVEMIRLARESDYFTMGYSYTPQQGQLLSAAGVDVIVPHAGWTTGGLVGSTDGARSLKEAADHVQSVIEIARKENPDVICLAHGGSFSSPDDTEYLYANTDAQGFVGASSIERIPIEQAVMSTVAAFKSKSIAKRPS
jgi:predicted TIM-barrel enzyme